MTSAVASNGGGYYKQLLDGAKSAADAYRQRAEARVQFAEATLDRNKQRVDENFGPPAGALTIAYANAPLYNRINITA